MITGSADGVGFQLRQGQESIGIANVRGRLTALCSGALEIHSEAEEARLLSLLYQRGQGLMKFLVVDDEPLVLQDLEDMLREAVPDCQVWGVASPRQALACA